MSTQLKLRRGTTAQHSTFTGASGEVTVDTDKKAIVVHDGVTAGGYPQVSNQPTTRPSIRPSLLLDFSNTKQLDPRITFSRPTTATYYDGKTVVKAEENLLVYSQVFTNAAWSPTNATVTSNSTTAPDSTTTASTLTPTASNNNHTVGLTSTIGVAGTYTFSGYLLQGGSTYASISANNGASNWVNVAINLSTGVITQTQASGTFSYVSSSIVPVGSWYRVSVTFTTTSAGFGASFSINNTGTPSIGSYGVSYWTAAGTETVYIWGAQLEQRSVVTAYIPTTTAPITNYIPALQTAVSNDARFDHDPVTGESKGLLIEEQRTNLLLRSSEFDNALWWGKVGATVQSNVGVAPDGMLTANNAITASLSNTIVVNADVFQDATSGWTSGVTRTFSVYAKTNGLQYLAMGVHNYGSLTTTVTFNLLSGTVQTQGSNFLTINSSSILAVGNGWYRCVVTLTSTDSSSKFAYVVGSSTFGGANNREVSGNGFSGIYIWGAQLEAGSFATSYIPTVASQVTRSADSASMTGSNFSSWYRQDQGSWYFNGTVREDGSTYNYTNLVLASPDTYSGVGTGFNCNSNGTNVYFRSGSGNVSPASITTAGTTLSIVGAYAVGDVSASSSGAAVVTSSTNTIQPCTALFIGNVSTTYPMNGTIKRIAYYPKRLSNTELQGVTS